MSSTTSPSLTSSAAASASAATSTSTSPSSSPPIFVGFIGVGVLTLCLISLCLWRRIIGRHHPFNTSAHDPNARRLQNDHGSANGRPEMFDAWMGGERACDALKWEESMPFSVVLMDKESNNASDVIRKWRTGKHRSDSAKEKEKLDPRSSGSGLQVAVLVAMPSPFHPQPHDHVGHEASGSSLRDELAIGLIEIPWNKEDRRSHRRNAS